MNEVEAVKAAIKLASCPGREGPFGGYDYGHNEAFYGPAPEDGRYVIRDFRDRKSPDWGKWLHQTDNREEHEAMFVKMTDDHIAHSAIAALDAVRGQAEPAAWMPIETAPKDGTTIDVWRDGHRYTVYWGLPPHCCGEMGQYCDSDWHGLKEPGWICSTFGEFVGGEHHPFTHWMPLPDAPEQSND